MTLYEGTSQISKTHICSNPGKASDDQALYRSDHPETETTSHPGHATGEGSHLAGVRGENISKPINVTGDQTPNTSATAGQRHLPREAPTGPGGLNPAVPYVIPSPSNLRTTF